MPNALQSLDRHLRIGEATQKRLDRRARHIRQLALRNLLTQPGDLILAGEQGCLI